VIVLGFSSREWLRCYDLAGAVRLRITLRCGGIKV
jgi:hypothetical protein